MSVDAVKLFRPQQGDIVIVDFNKVNVTQVENAVKDFDVPVIAVHDIDTIKIFGLREQKDFTQQNADLQLQLDAAEKEIRRLNRIIKDDMIPKAQSVAASTNVVSTPSLPPPTITR
jgi:hypothetical protein